MTTVTRLRRAALIAGLGLLLMAVLAGLANVAVLGRLVTDDPAQTTQRLRTDQPSFQLAIAGLSVAAVLDVLVAWTLWVLFDHVQHTLALVAAWCRTVYAAIFAVAIAQLVAAAGLLHRAGSDAAAAPGLSHDVSTHLDRFHQIWNLGLGLFGIHLLLIGALAWRSAVVGRVIAVPVAVAGAGYLIDSVGSSLSTSYSLNVSAVTFIGEVVLMVRLLIYASRRVARPDRLPGGDVIATGRS